jgi:hypothetical protein
MAWSIAWGIVGSVFILSVMLICSVIMWTMLGSIFNWCGNKLIDLMLLIPWKQTVHKSEEVMSGPCPSCGDTGVIEDKFGRARTCHCSSFY